jgi:hypothetical protein
MAYFLVSESLVQGQDTQSYEEDTDDIHHRERNLGVVSGFETS